MAAFIQKHLKYPKDALENKIEGKVFLTFRVEYNGIIKDIKVLSGLGHGCDEEACRVVGLMKYTEAKNKGGKISVQRKLAIQFKLPKQKIKPQANIQYVIKHNEENQKSVKYSYTINLTKK